MKLSEKVLAQLHEEAHPHLVRVVQKFAEIYPKKFVIIDIARTPAEQKKNLAKGVSQTSRSRHVPANNICNLSCAVDIAPLALDGKSIPWKQWNLFSEINKYMQEAARQVSVNIEWGGNWKTIKDGDHWQLPKSIYKAK